MNVQCSCASVHRQSKRNGGRLSAEKLRCKLYLVSFVKIFWIKQLFPHNKFAKVQQRWMVDAVSCIFFSARLLSFLHSLHVPQFIHYFLRSSFRSTLLALFLSRTLCSLMQKKVCCARLARSHLSAWQLLNQPHRFLRKELSSHRRISARHF